MFALACLIAIGLLGLMWALGAQSTQRHVQENRRRLLRRRRTSLSADDDPHDSAQTNSR